MQFEWNYTKAEAVWEKHGIKFEDAIFVFAGRRTEKEIVKNGEQHFITVGEVEGRLMTVIYTKRGDVIRLITARRARKNEKRAYYSHDT